MDGTQYLNQKLGKTIFILAMLFAIASVSIMVLNLYKGAKGIELLKENLILRPIARPVSHEKYESLITSFRELYIPDNVHKRNIFSEYKGGTGVDNTGIDVLLPGTEFKDIRDRLRVSKIYKKPVKLLFKGYMQLADNVYVATINWGGKTDFKKVGDVIRGYKVIDFKKNVSEQKTPWGGTEKIDQSVIILQRDAEEKLDLEIGKITLEKEIYAEILDRKDAKLYEVYIGSLILDNKVLDISISQVIINTPNGEKVSLVKEADRV